MLVGSGIHSFVWASTIRGAQWGQLEAGLPEAITWITQHTPETAAFLTEWSEGYDVQTHARRATATDGFAEHPLAIDRLPRIAEAFVSSDETRLLELCREFQVSYVLVPPANRIYSYSREAGVPSYHFVDHMGMPTARGKTTVFLRMVFAPELLAGFELLYKTPGPVNRSYKVYRVRE